MNGTRPRGNQSECFVVIRAMRPGTKHSDEQGGGAGAGEGRLQ